MTAHAPEAATLAFCADDFGISQTVSEAIAALAAQGCLSATSCLVNDAGWLASAAALRALPPRLGLGLHFDLTEGPPLSPALRRVWPTLPRLPALIARAHLGRLPLAAIADEWQAQWQRFAEVAGRAPDFVDGHQHVHHLPGVRDIVLAAAQEHRLAVRSTARVGGPAFAAKRWLIEHTGGRTLGRALDRRQVPHNALLLGAYDFGAHDLRALMRGWLATARVQGAGSALLFCHPGAADGGRDPIAAARVREAAYLGSDAFAADLAAAGLSVAPCWPRRSSGG